MNTPRTIWRLSFQLYGRGYHRCLSIAAPSKIITLVILGAKRLGSLDTLTLTIHPYIIISLSEKKKGLLSGVTFSVSPVGIHGNSSTIFTLQQCAVLMNL